jgi:hypothetical protein
MDASLTEVSLQPRSGAPLRAISLRNAFHRTSGLPVESLANLHKTCGMLRLRYGPNFGGGSSRQNMRVTASATSIGKSGV